MKKQRRRIMRSLKIQEISAVDRPAQEGARMVLMKRADVEKRLLTPREGESRSDFVSRFVGSEAMKNEFPDREQRLAVANDQFGKVAKRLRLTSAAEGHQHSIDDSEEGGTTSWEMSEGEEMGHHHSWVRNFDGSIEIGLADGHSHAVDMDDSMVIELRAPDPDQGSGDIPENVAAGDGGGQPLEGDMTKQQAAAEGGNEDERVGKLEKQLEVATALASMTDDQKSFYSKLDEACQASFRKLDAGARDAEIEKSRGDDPVVYTSLDGSEFRKSDDPRVVNQAKRADKLEKQLAASQADVRKRDLEKRAKEELGHLPGDLDVKTTLLGKVDGIEDEAIRRGVSALLKAADGAIANGFQTFGTSSPGGEPLSKAEAERKLDELATAKGGDFAKAYAEVLETPEGQRLYQMTVAG